MSRAAVVGTRTLTSLAALGLGLSLALGGCASPEVSPNLLIITLDTTRADRFGFTGHDPAQTPNFDRFAAERAAWFENAITAVPVTFPSHTTIMTGTYPVFHGVHDNDGYVLDDDVTTLAEILKANGFTTGAVLAAFPLDSEVNLDQGFDTYDDDYQADWSESELLARGPLSFGFLERKADRVNLAVNRWLDDNASERFFLWIHYFDPHQPYDPPPPYDSQFAAEPYDGEMAFLDEQFGELLESLEERALLEETVIVIAGDHGEALDEHSEPTHAHFVYDATMRVPLFVAVPPEVAAARELARSLPGTRVRHQVRTVDIAPTVLDLLTISSTPDMQGDSLVPLLQNPTREWGSEALLENYYPKFNYGWSPLRGLRTDRVKLVEAPVLELYDLESDPDELVNLAASRPEELDELRERLHRLARRLGSPDLARSTAAQVDDETREKLEALGYLGGGSTASEREAPFPRPAELATLIDGKSQTLVVRHLNFINELLRAQRYGEALPVIDDALRMNPENFRLHVHHARALAASSRWEAALEATWRAQQIQPENAEAYAIEAFVHASLGDFDEALDPLHRAVELFPQRVESLQQLAGVYLALGRYDDAISHFEAVLELDPANWTALADLGQALSLVDRWEEAQQALQRALHLRPYSSQLRYQIGAFYRDAGNPEFGRRMFEEALRIDPNDLATNFDLGALLIDQNDPENGRAYLEHVVSLAPESTWGHRASELLATTPQ